MLNMKCAKNSLLLLFAAVGVSACSLPSAKKPVEGTGSGGMTAMCSDEAAGGGGGMGPDGSAASGTGGMGGSVPTYPIDREVTPMACSGDGVDNPRAIDRYSQGYKPAQADVDRAMTTANGMSVAAMMVRTTEDTPAMLPYATTSPSAPPNSDSSRLSVTSC